MLERAAGLSAPARALLWALPLAAAAAAERFGGPPWPQSIGDALAGLSLLVGAFAAYPRSAGAAALMLLTAATWFAGDLTAALLFAHRGPLVHLLLAYPAARLCPAAVAGVVALAYIDGLVPGLARSDGATIVLFSAVLMAAGWRYRVARGVVRRACGVALGASLLVCGTLVAIATTQAAGSVPGTAAVWAFDMAVAVAAIGLGTWLRWGWTGSAVTGMVVELGDRHEPQALRATLARAIGDPGLQVVYRVAGDRAWRDETGVPFTGLPDGDGKVVTFVEEDGEAIAALVHDPAALANRELAASVASAVRMAVANVRMQAEVAERVLEVDRSRQRLVEAGDQERHELQDALRTGAERRLADLSRALHTPYAGPLGVDVERLSGELDGARTELHDFAQGVYPRALTEGGLAPALAELASRSAVPVALDVPEARFPAPQEAAVYFVCSEALANVGKYAGAESVTISVREIARALRVTVIDDGRGGAEAAKGSGLRGLVDRVEALGGSLRLDSVPGAGTRLDAELPLPAIEDG